MSTVHVSLTVNVPLAVVNEGGGGGWCILLVSGGGSSSKYRQKLRRRVERMFLRSDVILMGSCEI